MTVPSLNKMGYISCSAHWILKVGEVKPLHMSVSPWNSLGHIPTSGESRGGARGARPPLFLVQTEARRTEKTFFGNRVPPLSKGLDPALPNHLQSAASLITLQDRVEDSTADKQTSALWPYTRTMSDCSDVSLIVWKVLWAYYWWWLSTLFKRLSVSAFG